MGRQVALSGTDQADQRSRVVRRAERAVHGGGNERPHLPPDEAIANDVDARRRTPRRQPHRTGSTQQQRAARILSLGHAAPQRRIVDLRAHQLLQLRVDRRGAHVVRIIERQQVGVAPPACAKRGVERAGHELRRGHPHPAGGRACVDGGVDGCLDAGLREVSPRVEADELPERTDACVGPTGGGEPTMPVAADVQRLQGGLQLAYHSLLVVLPRKARKVGTKVCELERPRAPLVIRVLLGIGIRRQHIGGSALPERVVLVTRQPPAAQHRLSQLRLHRRPITLAEITVGLVSPLAEGTDLGPLAQADDAAVRARSRAARRAQQQHGA
eukprot:377858-Prymnesium_polylepis.1